MPYLYIVVSGVLAGVLFSGFLANVSHKRVREILTMLLAYFAAIYQKRRKTPSPCGEDAEPGRIAA